MDFVLSKLWMESKIVKVGDLVRLVRSHNIVGIIKSTLNGDGFYDVLRTDGVTLFVHISSMELISESR